MALAPGSTAAAHRLCLDPSLAPDPTADAHLDTDRCADERVDKAGGADPGDDAYANRGPAQRHTLSYPDSHCHGYPSNSCCIRITRLERPGSISAGHAARVCG